MASNTTPASSKDQNEQCLNELEEVNLKYDQCRTELEEVKAQFCTELEEVKAKYDQCRTELEEVKAELNGRSSAPEKERNVFREFFPKQQTDQSQVSAGYTNKKNKSTDCVYIRQVNKDDDEKDFIQKFSLFGEKQLVCLEEQGGEAYPTLFVCKCTSSRYITDLEKCFKKAVEEKVQDRAAIVYVHMEELDKNRGTTYGGLHRLREMYPACKEMKIYHMTFHDYEIPKSMLPFRKSDNQRVMLGIQEFVKSWYEKKMSH